MADSQSNTSELKSGIYAIRCTVNGKVYVGSAVNIVGRWRLHKHHLTQHKHHSKHLQRAWDKLGPEAFSWEILESVEPEQLIEREQHYIDSLRTFDREHGFNISSVAGSPRGVKHSEAARAKMSIAARSRSPETLAKMSAAQKKRCSTQEFKNRMSEVNLGRPLSAETKSKMSESRRGRIVSPETRAKIAESHQGKKASPESRAKMSESRLGRRRKAFTAETIAKMRIAAAQREALKRQSKLNSKPASHDQSFFQWPED